MAAEAVRPAPWGATLGAEVRRVGLGIRPLALPIALLLLGFGGWVLYDYYAAGVTMSWRGAPFLPILITWALCLRILFLQGKDGRGYILSLPIGRRRSVLTTLASGWVWVMLLVTVYLAGCVLLLELAGPVQMARLWFLFTWPLPSRPVGYAVPYVSMTVVYLLVCAPMVIARQPTIWPVVLVGTGLLYRQAVAGSEGSVVGSFAEEVLGRGQFGLTTALMGKWNVTASTPVAEAAPGMVLSFDTSGWLMAAGVWIAVTLGAAAILASVHREA